MRRGRIFVDIVLLWAAALVVSAVATYLLIDGSRPNLAPEMRRLSKLLMLDLSLHRHDAQALLAEIDRLKQYPVRSSLYDSSGRLLASSVWPPLPMVSATELVRLQVADELQLGGTYFVYAGREGGRLVTVGVFAWESFRAARIALRLLGPFLGLLIFAAYFARYLTRPLQQLADTARRFGRGELGARTRLQRSDEIGEVGRAFDEMADRITQLMASQQELLANVSHELQTPIARIHVALEHIAVKGLDKAKQLLPEIEIDLADLQRLFDDVMMVARLDLSRSQDKAARTPLRVEPMSLASLLERTATRFRIEHRTHTLHLELGPALPTIQGDSVLLRRALENLIENARKYSDPGSVIHLRAASSGRGVVIEVCDQGIGIDSSDLKQLFTPFFRSDRSRSRQTGGVGLGLTLARRVIEAHGGAIEIKSALGLGTTVKVELP